MSAIPTELQYTAEHEWVTTGDPATIGVTANAADALGDVVYLELPEVGSQVTAGAVCGEIESTKSVSEIYAPVTGSVAAVNADLADAPERLNEDPYGEGWICELEVGDPAQLDGLLDADGYRSLIEE